ncbi:hypothetical protein AB9J70_05985 [Elizabethkingia anophelis]|uniref:hypothetical protein n=1 Tax=Elizabethkingia anophelis TaxID=1117645 RepID=UPI00355678D3
MKLIKSLYLCGAIGMTSIAVYGNTALGEGSDSSINKKSLQDIIRMGVNSNSTTATTRPTTVTEVVTHKTVGTTLGVDTSLL